MTGGIVLNRLRLTGDDQQAAEIRFGKGLNVLYGASNTGKSFTLKVLDFMLGSSRELPDIPQRRKYSRAWLELSLPKSGDCTLVRALAGGAYEYHGGFVADQVTNRTNARGLSARHDGSNTDNLSQFLLDELGLSNCSPLCGGVTRA